VVETCSRDGKPGGPTSLEWRIIEWHRTLDLTRPDARSREYPPDFQPDSR
jgi:hypothetical protein